MKSDQASTLRELVNQSRPAADRPPAGAVVTRRPPEQQRRRVRVLSVTSGKGGVGKTNLTINLAYALASAGRRVFILDADLGLANIDVLLNISPPFTIEHVLSGEKNIRDIIVDGPKNMKILPASSGISDMAELDRDEQMKLFKKLGGIGHSMDYLLIDTGAGIASNVLRFNATADEILLVATPEPTSMTDAYSLVKILVTKYHVRRFNLIANSVSSKAEGRAVYERLHKVVNDFLQTELHYAGYVLRDENMTKVVRMQKPLLEVYPKSPAARCITAISQHIDQGMDHRPADPGEPQPEGFWDRLLHWSRKR